MNKNQCRELADKITEAEMTEMFENAKVEIKDWTKISRINKGFTRGVAWNILYAAFTSESPFRIQSRLAKRNMIFEFQDFLPKHLIPEKKVKNKTDVKITHQNPKF